MFKEWGVVTASSHLTHRRMIPISVHNVRFDSAPDFKLNMGEKKIA